MTERQMQRIDSDPFSAQLCVCICVTIVTVQNLTQTLRLTLRVNRFLVNYGKVICSQLVRKNVLEDCCCQEFDASNGTNFLPCVVLVMVKERSKSVILFVSNII